MTGHRIAIPRGWRLDRKTGRLVKCTRHLDAAKQAKLRGSSRKIRVAKRT